MNMQINVRTRLSQFKNSSNEGGSKMKTKIETIEGKHAITPISMGLASDVTGSKMAQINMFDLVVTPSSQVNIEVDRYQYLSQAGDRNGYEKIRRQVKIQ